MLEKLLIGLFIGVMLAAASFVGLLTGLTGDFVAAIGIF